MVMKKSTVFLSHLLLWSLLYAIAYILFSTLIHIIQPPYGILPSSVVSPLTLYMLIGIACPFYVYYVLFPRLMGREKKILWYAIAIIVLILLPIVFLQMDAEVISFSNYFTSFIFILFFSLLGGAFRSFFQWVRENSLREKQEKEHLKSEMALLRLQINPHFLFNTLHNIDALIIKEPATASLLLIKLSEMLRYMLYESDMNKVLLSKEIEFIENFISLQRQRFRTKDLIDYRKTGDSGLFKISPMLLISFVENAFKHYVPNAKGGGINIKIEVGKEHLNFSCSNSYNVNEVNKDKSSGIGLNAVKRRLELIYPNHYTLLIKEDHNNFNVNLIIPICEN